MGRAILFLLAADRAIRNELRRWAYRRSARILRAFGETRAAEILERLSAEGTPQAVTDYGTTEKTITGLPTAIRPPARAVTEIPQLYSRER